MTIETTQNCPSSHTHQRFLSQLISYSPLERDTIAGRDAIFPSFDSELTGACVCSCWPPSAVKTRPLTQVLHFLSRQCARNPTCGPDTSFVRFYQDVWSLALGESPWAWTPHRTGRYLSNPCPRDPTLQHKSSESQPPNIQPPYPDHMQKIGSAVFDRIRGSGLEVLACGTYVMQTAVVYLVASML